MSFYTFSGTVLINHIEFKDGLDDKQMTHTWSPKQSDLCTQEN